jgi:hypothetical protein
MRICLHTHAHLGVGEECQGPARRLGCELSHALGLKQRVDDLGVADKIDSGAGAIAKPGA